MTPELERLQNWIHIFLIVAAVCTTLFPLVWSFSPWWTTTVGRLLMLQSIALALAIDATAYFQFSEVGLHNINLIFWLNAVIFGLIALASMLLTVTMIRMNYFSRSRRKERPYD